MLGEGRRHNCKARSPLVLSLDFDLRDLPVTTKVVLKYSAGQAMSFSVEKSKRMFKYVLHYIGIMCALHIVNVAAAFWTAWSQDRKAAEGGEK